uniref:Mucolipin-3-like n=1 Tax=Dermatophagoides pteronyssinus TaxID=6956 RepID=A0A6P6XP10_DERPT|nr:mucolipin-3-like [Dermatophagoides pteronyssinus]
MSESVHAVVSNRQQQQRNCHNNNDDNLIQDVQQQQSIDNVHDDDDDIDIIGRSTNTDMTNMMPTTSSSLSSSNYFTRNFQQQQQSSSLNSSSSPPPNHQQQPPPISLSLQQQQQNSKRLRNSSSESSAVPTIHGYNHHHHHNHHPMATINPITMTTPNQFFQNSNITTLPPSSSDYPYHQHLSQQQQQQQSLNDNGKNNSTTQPTTTTTNEWSIDNNNSGLQQYRNRLRRRLRYHFMSPIDKWKIKGRFPWKLLLQIIKIILVTTQVILFGNNTDSIRMADNSMLMTLHDLFLLHWDSSLDHQTIPPNIGPYAVYTKDDVYRHIDYAIKNYANMSNLALGSFGYRIDHHSNNNNSHNHHHHHNNNTNRMSTITACFERYMNVTLNPTTSEYFIDTRIDQQFITIKNLYPSGSNEWKNFSFEQYLQIHHPEQLQFESLIHLSIRFPLRVILLNTLTTSNIPRCYDLNLAINFNNRPHSGEIAITMSLNKLLINCNGNLKAYNHATRLHEITIVINTIVLFLCSMSLILCLRTLMNAQSLRKETNRFFTVAYKRSLDTHSSLHFIDGWILMIVFNDCLLMIGTIINLLRLFDLIGPHRIDSIHPIEWDNLCSALLGVGLLLVWFGILRYLTFFDQYNILLVTIKHSLSRVLRFMLCVLVLYGGFCFSGWIILGPYHFKFYTLARTSECLFALMNGDDVFATFAYLESTSLFVWWFSRFYLYSYVLLFIYVVLSLFIAILMDSYETIKDYYAHRSNQRTVRVDFTWSNDQLSRFLIAIFNDNDDDNNLDSLSSYRFSLIQDEHEQHRINDTNQSNNNNNNQYNCCSNCNNNNNNHQNYFACWRWPLLQILTNFFNRLFNRSSSSSTANHHSSSISTATTSTDGDMEPLTQTEMIN